MEIATGDLILFKNTSFWKTEPYTKYGIAIKTPKFPNFYSDGLFVLTCKEGKPCLMKIREDEPDIEVRKLEESIDRFLLSDIYSIVNNSRKVYNFSSSALTVLVYIWTGILPTETDWINADITTLTDPCKLLWLKPFKTRHM